MELSRTLERMARKFARRAPLREGDLQALMALPFEVRVVEAGCHLVREGDRPKESALLLSGLAFRHKLTAEGHRQIVSLHVPGDFVDLEGTLLKVADHNVEMLTRSEVATIAQDAVLALIDGHPRIARALWVDTLIDASIYREWVVNVGHRPARQRIGHLLCELARRLEFAGMGDTGSYEFPMTQEQLADATGLTSVHVNRTLKALEAEGLIERHGRSLTIPDWNRLRRMSGFNEVYLHLDQVA